MRSRTLHVGTLIPEHGVPTSARETKESTPWTHAYSQRVEQALLDIIKTAELLRSRSACRSWTSL